MKSATQGTMIRDMKLESKTFNHQAAVSVPMEIKQIGEFASASPRKKHN